MSLALRDKPAKSDTATGPATPTVAIDAPQALHVVVTMLPLPPTPDSADDHTDPDADQSDAPAKTRLPANTPVAPTVTSAIAATQAPAASAAIGAAVAGPTTAPAPSVRHDPALSAHTAFAAATTTPAPAANFVPAIAAAPPLQMHGAVSASPPAAAETPTDFATLVDSIARARSDSAHATTGAVGVTLSHADFGRVSLQFSPRDEGLSVTMRSADPGFAPAVAAASPSSAGAGSDNHTDQQAQNAGSGSGNAPRSDTGRQSTRQNSAHNPTASAHGSSDATDDADIFA